MNPVCFLLDRRKGGGSGEPLVDGVYIWKKYTGADIGLYSERDPLQLAVMSGFDSLKYVYGKPIVPLFNEFGERCGAYTINENELVLEKTDGSAVSAPYTLLEDGVTLECSDPQLFIPEGCYMNGVNVLLVDFKGYAASDDEFGYPNNGHDGQFYYVPYGHQDFRHGDTLWLRMQQDAIVEVDELSFTLAQTEYDEKTFYVWGYDFDGAGVRDVADEETGELIVSWKDFFHGFRSDYGYFVNNSGSVLFVDGTAGKAFVVENYEYATNTMTFVEVPTSLAGQEVQFICQESPEFALQGFTPKKYFYTGGLNNYTVGNWGTFEDGQEVDGFTMQAAYTYPGQTIEIDGEYTFPKGTLFLGDVTIKTKAT